MGRAVEENGIGEDSKLIRSLLSLEIPAREMLDTCSSLFGFGAAFPYFFDSVGSELKDALSGVMQGSGAIRRCMAKEESMNNQATVELGARNPNSLGPALPSKEPFLDVAELQERGS